MPHVVVVGGGQAGLSTSYCLQRRGIDHVVLDRGRVGDTWRRRWDSFCLVTPNWQCQLPGHPYDGDDPDGFMGRDAIVDYVQRYVSHFDPPLRNGVEVTAVRRDGEAFVVDTSEGELSASNVVIAAGTFHHPKIPACASGLAPGVAQIHSSEYRNPDALAPGAVLVVGSGQSGCQIVEDLQRAGRVVHLAVGDAGRVPRRYRGRDVLLWAKLGGRYDQTVGEHPRGPAIRFVPHPHVSGRDGGHTIDLRELAIRGVHLYGPLTGCEGTRVSFSADLSAKLAAADAFCGDLIEWIDGVIEAQGLDAGPRDAVTHDWEPGDPVTDLDLDAAGVTTIVWATGFGYDFSWIDAPVFDDRGYPKYERGVTEHAGLYFVGLHWLHTWGSGLFSGVGADAEHVAAHIETRAPVA